MNETRLSGDQKGQLSEALLPNLGRKEQFSRVCRKVKQSSKLRQHPDLKEAIPGEWLNHQTSYAAIHPHCLSGLLATGSHSCGILDNLT